MIYFVEHVDSGLIKIGYTTDYDRRHLQLTVRFGILRFLGIMEGTVGEEHALHRHFKSLHVRTPIGGDEWFKSSPELLAYIQANTVMKMSRAKKRRTVPLILPEELRDFIFDMAKHKRKSTAQVIEDALFRVYPDYPDEREHA